MRLQTEMGKGMKAESQRQNSLQSERRWEAGVTKRDVGQLILHNNNSEVIE
jgi:hypothetical protein